MDFSFSSDQSDLRELAAKILADGTEHERVRSVLATDLATDGELWRTMAEAGLVGISLPESVGGGGLGFLESCIVLEEVGRTAAPVPALAVLGLGGLALTQYAPDGGAAHLAGVADGSRVVTAALVEALGEPFVPSTTATGDRLNGEKVCVPSGLLAEGIVVSADAGLFVVDPSSDGVTIEREDTTSGIPEARLVLRGRARRAARGSRRCRVARRARAGRHERHGRGRVRGGARADRELHQDARAVRTSDRVLPGREPSARPTRTWTPRPCG